MEVDEDIMHISNLPDEVLEVIFDHLQFRAHLNARLVCRRWFNILLAQKYRKQEKIVVRGLYPVEEILNVLSKFSGGLHHLEFQDVYLDAEKFDSSFWIAHGARIKDLRIHYCTADPETFLCIVIHCVNLESLYWINYSSNSPICSSETLDCLIHMNFSARNSLTHFVTGAVNLDWLSKFRKVFPNVERIKYSLDPLVINEDNAKETSKTSRINDGVLNLPEISEKILYLHFRNLSANFLRRTLASAYELQWLREIDIHPDNMEIFPKEEFLLIISNQPLLEKFTFIGDAQTAPNGMIDFGESLLTTLFESSCKLRWLHYQLECHFLSIDAKLFAKIKHSQLSYLLLHCSFLRMDEVLSTNSPKENSQKNSSLRYLCVRAPLESTDEYLLLLRSFSHLEYLEINFIPSDEVLKSITLNQSQLKGLRFIAEKLIDESLNCYQFCHFEKLKNLRYLSLQFLDRLEGDGLAEFRLPNSVEFLSMIVEGVDYELQFFEDWLNALARSENLRALELRYFPSKIRFESFLKLCSSLKNLEYLNIQGEITGEDDDKEILFSEDELKRLFHASVSLRVITQITRITGDNRDDEPFCAAFYDRVKKEIVNISDHWTYRVSNSYLAYYDINWLFF